MLYFYQFCTLVKLGEIQSPDIISMHYYLIWDFFFHFICVVLFKCGSGIHVPVG